MNAKGRRRGLREDFRAPTEREREVLEMLLSVDVPAIDALRAQVPVARVARWDCGCPSFDVAVDRDRVPRARITASPAVEAITKEQDDPDRAFELLLWVDDGWIAGVELIDYVERHGDESPDEIPSPAAWRAPKARP